LGGRPEVHTEIAPAIEPPSLHFVVQDESGTPLIGVELDLKDVKDEVVASTATDIEGRATIPNQFPPGDYTIVVVSSSTTSRSSKPVAITPGVSLDIMVIPAREHPEGTIIVY